MNSVLKNSGCADKKQRPSKVRVATFRVPLVFSESAGSDLTPEMYDMRGKRAQMGTG
jgi:hypothetical protein